MANESPLYKTAVSASNKEKFSGSVDRLNHNSVERSTIIGSSNFESLSALDPHHRNMPTNKALKT